MAGVSIDRLHTLCAVVDAGTIVLVYSCELIRGGKSEVNREERDG